MVGGQMSSASSNCDSKDATPVNLARNAHGAVVQPRECLNERQADTTALERAPMCTCDTMEALKQVRQFLRWDACPGVTNCEFDQILALPQADRDLTCEGKLERVREEIKDN